jgi:hypothetical protein
MPPQPGARRSALPRTTTASVGVPYRPRAPITFMAARSTSSRRFSAVDSRRGLRRSRGAGAGVISVSAHSNQGRTAQRAAARILADVEQQWSRLLGRDQVTMLRRALEQVIALEADSTPTVSPRSRRAGTALGVLRRGTGGSQGGVLPRPRHGHNPKPQPPDGAKGPQTTMLRFLRPVRPRRHPPPLQGIPL